MAQAKKKTTSNSRKKTGSRQAPKRSSSGSRKNSRKKTAARKERMEPDLKKELVILAALAVSILLFCSSMGWCGSFGGVIRQAMRGVFGIAGYLFPFYLFFLVCFLVSNGGSARSVFRALVSFLMFAAVCGVISLLAAGAGQVRSMGEYYEAAQDSVSGGVLGGLFVNLLYPALGRVGSYVVLLLFIAMAVVIVTERSILKPTLKGGKKVYDTARDDMARRHEIHAARTEERKKYRAEKKIRGVSMDTDLDKEKEKEPEKPEKPAAAPKKEDGSGVFLGEIHGMTGQDTEEAFYMEEQEPLKASPVKSTLSELEAMDALPAGEAAAEEIFREDGWEREFSMEQEEAPGVSGDAAADPDVRKVVTAGGKVIQVEKDPTEEDPLTAKRTLSREEKSVFRREGSVRGGSGSARFTDMEKVPSGQEAGVSEEAEKKPPRPYEKPPIRLLAPGRKRMKNRDAELKETAVKLQQTLKNFGVGVTVSNISCGPSVTRYELIPEQGVKVSRITALSDDIKLSLAAADVRIEAPIPGKSAVGIEVPNKENMTVFLRDVIESEEFMKFPSKLAFAVGRDIAGQVVVTDLAKMPHLLIAGATGSGKSVCINTLIVSLLYKADPSEVKLIMIDPKVVELSVYNGIPHLMIPVVTDPKKAAGALNWAVAEMTDRYKHFAELNVRDLKGYNEKAREEGLAERPQVVIIVDELSDLMMVAPGEVEDAICRLAQMARAAGIHLVLATQRPSVNVITGLIKANIPSRIAFSVSSSVDSRTIIDMGGAEKLLGRGDMLFYPSGYQKPARVQGAFVSDEEVSRIVKFLTDRGGAQYSEEVESQMSSAVLTEGGKGGEQDEYFAEAGRFLIGKEKGSIGMLQRAFKIGFNRAARIMDQLCAAGVVGEEEGTKPRKVLMTLEEFEEFLNRQG